MFSFPIIDIVFFSHYSYAGKTDGQISETQAFEETQTLLLTPKNLGMCIFLLFYTKTIFMPSSSLDVAAIFWRLLDVIANFQCSYAYKQWL
jgi:hypothetical protein